MPKQVSPTQNSKRAVVVGPQAERVDVEGAGALGVGRGNADEVELGDHRVGSSDRGWIAAGRLAGVVARICLNEAELCAQRELARAGAEADLDQQRLQRRADDGLAVDALQRQLASAPAGDELRRAPRTPAQARIGVVDERRDPRPPFST